MSSILVYEFQSIVPCQIVLTVDFADLIYCTGAIFSQVDTVHHLRSVQSSDDFIGWHCATLVFYACIKHLSEVTSLLCRQMISLELWTFLNFRSLFESVARQGCRLEFIVLQMDKYTTDRQSHSQCLLEKTRQRCSRPQRLTDTHTDGRTHIYNIQTYKTSTARQDRQYLPLVLT